MPVTCNCAAVRGRGGEILCFHAITETSMELHYLGECVGKNCLNVLYFVYNSRNMVFSKRMQSSTLKITFEIIIISGGLSSHINRSLAPKRYFLVQQTGFK